MAPIRYRQRRPARNHLHRAIQRSASERLGVLSSADAHQIFELVRAGKVARLNGIFKRIYAKDAQYALMTRLVQKEGKRLGVWIPRRWARVYMPSFRFDRHF